MILADTLSCLPNPIINDDVDMDVRVDGLALEAEDPQHLTIALINFPTAKQQLLNAETLRDPVLNALKEIIYKGWPDNVKELPSDLPWKQVPSSKDARYWYHRLYTRTFSSNCTVVTRGSKRREYSHVRASTG